MSTSRSLSLLLIAVSVVSGCTCRTNRLDPSEQIIPMQPVDAGPTGCAANTEVCNNLDDDCDGAIDEDQPTVRCGVGACEREMPSCANGGTVTCMPLAPTAEVCNGADDDCDGETDEGLLPTMCGVGECAAMSPTCVTGNPMTCMPTAGTTEVCNGKDDDCDGTVDEELLENTTGDVRITTNNAASDYVYMGKSDTGFGTVWQDKRDGAEGQIYFAALNNSGVRASSTDTRVSNTGGSSVHPALEWNGSSWGLLYADDVSGKLQLYFRPLNANGSPTAAALKLNTSTAGNSDWPDLVWTGSSYAVAYDDSRAGANKHDIFFQRLDRNGARVGNEVRITTDPARQSSPILKWTGSEFGVAWTDYRNDGNREIYFRRLAADGTPVGPEVRVTNDGADSAWPDLAWNDVDHEWALVWHDTRDGNAEVYFTRLNASGVKQGNDVRLTQASGFSGYASIDWNGFQFGVSWQDDRVSTNKPFIYFAQVSATGMKNGTDLQLSSGTGESSFTTAVWNGSTFAFCWRDDRNGGTNTELYFALVGCPR